MAWSASKVHDRPVAGPEGQGLGGQCLAHQDQCADDRPGRNDAPDRVDLGRPFLGNSHERSETAYAHASQKSDASCGGKVPEAQRWASRQVRLEGDFHGEQRAGGRCLEDRRDAGGTSSDEQDLDLLSGEPTPQPMLVGPTRTMQQDPSYGIRQLADVALIALSPGVNDPTTAQDAIFHIADVLREVFDRDLPPEAMRGERDRQLIDAEAPTHGAILKLAFDEIRRASVSYPTVCIYLLEALHLLELSLAAPDPDRIAPLHRQASQILTLRRHDAPAANRAYRPTAKGLGHTRSGIGLHPGPWRPHEDHAHHPP